ncbi:hypothetical protein Syn7502_02389 [Synechococcus sp. PCC 7502]|uniref:ferritin-like domain-containing protein n=1 Tax=Synechococcus sp. PCC 7502 TaxID=1173263 RepID=UPI00029F94EE|nr:ferritin-like domain-containing protein [Synechococcus sp. PCC 7502]AFY74374.1 hypothetical protein Syn7502_02389 [Synechococcus sp. PCC 7502]
MNRQTNSRRELIKTGMFGAAGLTAFAVVPNVLSAQNTNTANDLKILNGALFYEHQAIWAYSFAAGKLSQSAVGKAVLEIALANQADHKAHRDVLSKVIKDLGGTPVTAQADYLATVTPYIKNGDGNLDTDVNIAKLALALEVDAAIAYGQEAAKLKTPAIITAAASIGSTEASHATVIRSAFKSLGVDIKVIPAAFVSADTRKNWIIKV